MLQMLHVVTTIGVYRPIMLGAIGVSGASSDQDEECAQAAIDSVRDLLK